MMSSLKKEKITADCPTCQTMFRVHETMGPYVIKGKIGAGGMSVVYRAQDSILGRASALKILNETYALQEERIKRFESEAQIMAKVQHPNIVKIYGVGHAQEHFYIAMELIDGRDLETVMHSSGAIPEMKVLDIAIQLAEGLKAAWRGGVLHRDIKPANILIDSNGVAKIVDFGLSLLQNQQDQGEAIWITPFYAAPEALLRKQEDLRADMYALGATLSHLLVGKIPVSNLPKKVQSLWETKKDFPSVTTWYPEISPMTGQIIDRLMKFRVGRRYPNYNELLADLNEARAKLLKGGDDWIVRRRVLRRTARRMEARKILLSVILSIVLLIGLVWGSYKYISSPPKLIPVASANQPEKQIKKDLTLTGQQINDSYRLAEELFAKNDMIGAEREFNNLMNNHQIPLEVSTWASIQTALYSWIKGDIQLGENYLETIKNRMTIAPPKEKSSRGMRELKNLIDDLLRRPSRVPTPTAIDSRLSVLSHVGSLLKYWKLSRCEDSDIYLKKLQQASRLRSETGDFAREWLNCLAPYAHDLNNFRQLQNQPELTEAQIVKKIKLCNDLINSQNLRQAPGTEFALSLVSYRQTLKVLAQEITDQNARSRQRKDSHHSHYSQQE
ncbi:MAG: serine/threonine-protein kinase [Akkermansia sp.]